MNGGEVRSVGVSNSKKRPSHHEYTSPKQFLLILYFESSELKDSMRT